MREVLDAIVVGGGLAGLAAGYHLQQAGLRFTILEADSQPGGSWPKYYNSLTLFSPARYSSLPGWPIPGDPARYPHRDEVIDYLRQYARRFDLPVETSQRVEAVTHESGQFSVHSSDQVTWRALSLVAASGAFCRPYMPTLPGQESFTGQVLHSASYRQPEGLAGKRVVVVGAGNSAVQIAIELAQVAQVTLATRRQVRFVPQRILGCDLHGWLRWSGLDYVRWLKDHGGPFVLDAGKYRQALKVGKPDRRPLFEAFTSTGVRWSESDEEPIDAVIFATGYRPNFPYLAEIGALDDEGIPRQHKGISRTVPGLYYVGLSGQRHFNSATLRGVGSDAAYVVRHLRRHVRDEA